MSKKKFKIKEYLDDPGYKYIVIQDPWPANKVGAARDDVFYNLVGAWLFYMLDKKATPDTIYSLNTRSDVVARLPQYINIEPILGAHPYKRFLNLKKVSDKTSYIFEYNYRRKGHPEDHQWAQHFPIGGEPPPHLGFPVKFPYPHPSFADLANKTCQDIALPLPSNRTRTPTPPIPDTSGFEPYERPAHHAYTNIEDTQPQDPRLTAAVKESTLATKESPKPSEVVNQKQPSSAPLFVPKLDPYEAEDAALSSLKQEPEHALRIKDELDDSEVPPSLKAAMDMLEQLRAEHQTERPSVTSTSHVHKQEEPENVKPQIVKDEPDEPEFSPEFMAAADMLERLRAEHLEAVSQGTSEVHRVKIKQDTNEVLQSGRTVKSEDSIQPDSPFIRVKPEPQDDDHIPLFPSDSRNDSQKYDPRKQSVEGSMKRTVGDDNRHYGPTKRAKKEPEK
ncbi:hypothetical protein ABKN59_000267 [Abortiporus biennis]